jgi:hypothetical protein
MIEPGRDPERSRPVRFWRAAGHLIALAWISAMLLAAHRAPDGYWDAMQEDRVIEWWTALLFLAAGLIGMHRAVRRRRVGDALVALFCILVAGEEVSWGQRLIGYTPPAAFLEHNTQQEVNLHNFRDIIGQPKWLLAGILAAYGLLLPALGLVRVARRLLQAVRLTAPPAEAAPWFAIAIALLAWYPVEFTGEWVEALAGGLFLATAGGSAPTAVTAALVGLCTAVLLASASARRATSPELLACATIEVRALVDALPPNATPRLRRMRRVHKRVCTAVQDGYLREGITRALDAAACAHVRDGARMPRRRFVVDPWGTAYWLRVEKSATDTSEVVVYSFGPNRRRDTAEGGDDITAQTRLSSSP